MPKEKLILRPQDTKTVQLPGTISLPDGRKPIQLGSGTISSLISAGGMAIVYEIWNPELEVKRAVKLLKPDHTLESEDRFHTEMKITAKLHHPNIVEIYTVGTWDNLPYIEMELIDGVTLEKLIEESGGLPPEVCTSIGIMVGRALNYAHNQNYVLYGKHYQGVIHRDLKPGNIMVAKDGVAKLMDFGIAKPMTASIHTLEGMVMGTMQYLAPEQLDGKEVDVRADLYSLGTVLYEMVTGIRAFPEEKLGKLVTDKLANNYVPLTKFSTRVPASLAGLIHHCIRYDKEKRVQNSLEFLRAICRTHKTLTLKAPEQVLESFLASRGGEKRIVRVRRHSPVLPALIWTCTAIALIATATLVGLFVHKPALARRFIAQINLSGFLFAARPGNTAGGNTQDLGNLVDSVLALQRSAHEEDTVSAAAGGGDAAHGRLAPPETSPEKPAPNESFAPRKRGASPKRLPGRSERPAPQAAVGETSTGSGTAGIAESRLSEKLRRQLHNSDVMTVFSSEVEAGRFANGILLYKMLPAGLADSRKALLYKLRSLKGAGDTRGVRDFLETHNFSDGELLLEKARWCYTEKAFTAAYDFVKQASVSPAQFMDPRAFRELLLYSKALCASALYDVRPNADTRKEAMEAWFDVKSLFKTSPEHKYYVKADAEIRRISAHVAVK